MTNNQDLLSLTAFFSALAHAVIILGVSFKLPDIAESQNTDNTLDVVLINKSNNEVPDEADTISTQNNLGGGEDNTEASTPEPWKPANQSNIASVTKTARPSQKKLDSNALILGTGINIEEAKPEQAVLKNTAADQGHDKLSTKNKQQLERKQLIAKIRQDRIDYQKRPRRTYLSPTTKKHEAANYLNTWREKVETIGNANYPAKAKADGLSGSMIIDVAINKDGTIHSINVITPSPHKLLNDAAVRFIRDASPYAPFTDELLKTSDIIHITRSFHFLGNNRLTSSDASSAAQTTQ